MKKAIRSSISILMASVLLLTGCGASGKSSNNEEAPVESLYDTHMDISLAYWLIDDALSKGSDDKVLDYIEKRFNVSLIPVDLTWDDYYNKVILLEESGNLPDVFTGAYRKDQIFLQWAKEGILKEIPGNLSKYPNLEEYMNSPSRETCVADGKTYCIFRQTYSEQAETTKDRTILYRWDLAQKAGVSKEPSNWNEFRDMITKIRKADSEGKGIGGMTSKGFSMLEGLLMPYTVPYGSTGGSRFFWVEGPEGYVPALFSGETLGSDAIPMWQLVRDMYEEGTIEEDIVLVTTSQAEERFLNGKSSAICIDGGISNTKLYENIGRYWKDVHGTEFWDDVKYLKLMPDINGNPMYPIWEYAWSETYINANVSDEKLDRILALFDFFLSEEGTLMSNFGIEGESYSISEDGTITLFDDVDLYSMYPSIKAFSSIACWNYGNHNAYRYPDVVPSEYVLKDSERVDEARHVAIPPYNSECTDIFFEMGSDFMIDNNDIFKRMLLGTNSVEEDWNAIIAEYIDNGLLDVISEVNKLLPSH